KDYLDSCYTKKSSAYKLSVNSKYSYFNKFRAAIKQAMEDYKGSKTVKSSSGELEIQTPQDRHSSFEPEIVRKRQRILADNLEDKIIGLYGLGTSLRDISAHIQEMYDTEISTSVLSEITDRIVPKVKAWQSRPL